MTKHLYLTKYSLGCEINKSYALKNDLLPSNAVLGPDFQKILGKILSLA